MHFFRPIPFLKFKPQSLVGFCQHLESLVLSLKCAIGLFLFMAFLFLSSGYSAAQGITFTGQDKKLPVKFEIEAFRVKGEEPVGEIGQAVGQAASQTTSPASDSNLGSSSGSESSSSSAPESEQASGQKFTQEPGTIILLWIEPEKDHYAYANDPGEGGRPTAVTLVYKPTPNDVSYDSAEASSDEMYPLKRLPPEVIYPLGEQIADVYSDGKQVNVYKERTAIYIFIPALKIDEDGFNKKYLDLREINFDLEISMLVCSKKNCTPVKKTVPVKFSGGEIKNLSLAEDQPWWVDFSGARGIIKNQALGNVPGGIPNQFPAVMPIYDAPGFEIESLSKALALGFIAGLILNFMPCVFPVVSLKLLSFIMTLGQPDSALRIRAFRQQNAMFALGVLVWFTVMSALLSTMDMLWGQFFQSQAMVMAVLLLVFTLTLSLFGLFMLPSFSFREKQGRVTKRSAFLTGILATCLATPCSGPLLGGVLGWSFTQPQPILGIVFLAVGLGMASPYVLLSIFPSLGRYFPKPGPWLARLELAIGFFLMLTCAYLFSLLTGGVRIGAIVAMPILFVLGWFWGKHQVKRGYSLVFYWRWLWGCALALCAFILLWKFVLFGQSEGVWEPYSEARFLALQGEKNIVLDFTADWCPNCKILERTVFTGARMNEWLTKYDAVFMQVDLTNSDAEGYSFLAELGSSSIPVVALFPKNKNGAGQLEPVVLRDLFGPERLEEAAEKAWPIPKRDKH